MNVLSYGRPFGTPGEPLKHFVSDRGHSVRRAAYEDEADYRIAPGETVSALLARLPREWQPDLLLCWCPELVPPPFQVEKSPIPVVAVVSDWTVYGPQLEYNLSRYDAVVIDRLGEARFRPFGIAPKYIGPLYAHRSGVHRHLGLERDIDVAFAGNLNHAVHVRRGRILERAARLADQYRVVIASELDTDAYTALLNRARIVLNYGLRREMNLRCFEVLACGALLFVEEENLEVGDWLEDGLEAVRYREDTIEALIRERIEDPEGTARMAVHGHAALKRLSGEARLDDFIDAVSALPISGRPFVTLPSRERAMADIMQYASSDLPGHGEYVERRLSEAQAAWPEDAAFRMAAAALALGRVETLSGTAREAVLRGVLDSLRECATAHPDEVVGWLNLAFVTKLAGAVAAERRFLELALEATTVKHGKLLLGARMDPYYQRWREALAFGETNLRVLHAGAACRLAELELEAGKTAAAREMAERSAALVPDLAPAHRLLGRVRLAQGDAAGAVEVLRKSLGLTALDSTHRNALIDALAAAGAREEARTLAKESAVIFDAWPAAAEVAQAFRQRARTDLA